MLHKIPSHDYKERSKEVQEETPRGEETEKKDIKASDKLNQNQTKPSFHHLPIKTMENLNQMPGKGNRSRTVGKEDQQFLKLDLFDIEKERESRTTQKLRRGDPTDFKGL